ncbi:MAG TPA: hypothetical protein VMQ38_19925 [Mycobacterium sp.]|jgi:uncharacterized protein (UPF0147 family)|nr:hypothetical protein [Mycobacterium sp.]
MKRDQLILHRETLVKASQVLGDVVDDETAPDELRSAAADVEFA